jgi:N-acetylneuraminic acid mutarotase
MVSVGASPTSFTYQGRLFEGTNAATGLYDLRFTLHTANTGGNSFGTPVVTNAVPVTNGLFTAYLDFGAVFDGNPCWLEVAERTNGIGSFITLAPRQFITVVPQAAYAANAGKALSVAPGAVDSTAIAPGAVSASQLAPGAAAANLLASGQSGVGSGGIILSGHDSNSDLINAGYVKIAKVDLSEEQWTRYTNGPADFSQQRCGAMAVWTGSELVLWGGMTDPARAYEGARYNPALNSWGSFSPSVPGMAPDLTRAMVWTGSEVLIWGADTNRFTNLYTEDPRGFRYNPANGSTALMSFENAPEPRTNSVGLWCGNELIVWVPSKLGTLSPQNPVPDLKPGYGRRYNPGTDTWREINTTNSPSSAADSSAVWTGSEMVVWGGYEITVRRGPLGNSWVTLPLSGGSRYNPQTDQWQPMSNLNAPQARYGAPAVWSGTEMLVWGGEWHELGTNWGFPTITNHTILSSGAKYNPATDQWKPINGAGAPSAREDFALVWAGNRMIVWGGNVNGTADGTGKSYTPASDTWTALPTAGAPSARYRHAAAWTGSEVLVWGGENPAAHPHYPNSGARFNPSQNAWQPIDIGEPGARQNAAGVWTGSELLIWGGDSGERLLRSGARFNPALNAWRPVSLEGAPAARVAHTVVWSGSEMLVWGGSDGNALKTGGRYKPATDTWTAITSVGAPSARTNHTAVWSGSEMLIWGGQAAGFLSDGARYNPSTDSWNALSGTGEPRSRANHSAVWTGNEMIVWGGISKILIRPNPPLWLDVFNSDGARYNPVTDTWTPTSIPEAMEPRARHAAVWTGKEMVVCGGNDGFTNLISGWRYSPVADSWAPMSTNNAPEFIRGSDAIATDGTQVLILKSGAFVQRYVPHLDTWTAAPTTSPAPARANYLAVWTGTEVLVWGGGNTGTLTTDLYGYRPPIKAYLYLKP